MGSGLEMHILSEWDGWDIMDSSCFAFYNAVLKIDVGRIPAGTKVASANFDYADSRLDLYIQSDDAAPTETVALTLGVVTN